jgi:hypothetical protein
VTAALTEARIAELRRLLGYYARADEKGIRDMAAGVRDLLDEREAWRLERARMQIVGGMLLDLISQQNGCVQLLGQYVGFTEDADLCGWTDDAAANGRTADEVFGDGAAAFQQAFSWLAEKLPEEVLRAARSAEATK